MLGKLRESHVFSGVSKSISWLW